MSHWVIMLFTVQTSFDLIRCKTGFSNHITPDDIWPFAIAQLRQDKSRNAFDFRSSVRKHKCHILKNCILIHKQYLLNFWWSFFLKLETYSVFGIFPRLPELKLCVAEGVHHFPLGFNYTSFLSIGTVCTLILGHYRLLAYPFQFIDHY